MSTPAVNIDATGLVIRGYDPVAYFTEGRPVAGRSDLEVELPGWKVPFRLSGQPGCLQGKS